MCGRFTLKTPPDQWGQLLSPLIGSFTAPQDWTAHYNIAPTQNILAVAGCRKGDGGQKPERPFGCLALLTPVPFPAAESQSPVLDYFRWGLVPSWAAELSIGSRMINARVETLKEKPSFAGPLEERRCLILADGYYEWQKLQSGKKQPLWIAPKAGGLMTLAGLWDTNRRATGKPIRSCTIITTAANQAMAEIHDRMPVALDNQSAQRWIDTGCDRDEAYGLLDAAADDFYRIRKVSTLVNSPKHDSPECIAPVDDGALF